MKFLRLLLIVMFAAVGANAGVHAQTVKSIKQQKAKTQKEISETAKKIDKNKADTRRQLNQLNSITAEIDDQQRQIGVLVKQLDEINNQLKLVNDSIKHNEERLEEMRSEYGKAVKKIRVSSSSTEQLMFIFQSSSFHQAMRRIRYLREFSAWRQRRSDEIGAMQQRLADSRERINALATSKSENIKDQNRAKLVLEQKKRQQSDVVSRLKKEGAKLSVILAEKKRQADALDRELERVIEAERLAAERVKRGGKEEAKSPDRVKTDKQVEKIDEKLSGSFESNKGRLPYPVTGNFKIVRKFGVQQHPELKYVTTDNGGIDIETSEGAVARAIFPGKVSAIFRQDGFNTVVMVRHGSYLTIYVNLSEIYVRSGEEVKLNQNIGKIYSDSEDNNRTVLHFEVRNEKQKLNPEHWLRR